MIMMIIIVPLTPTMTMTMFMMTGQVASWILKPGSHEIEIHLKMKM